MANRPTLSDVARAAGVSVTTVDRAINGRATVRPETLTRIAEAAHRVGYHGRGLFQDRLDTGLPEMRLGFVLLKQTQEFYQNLVVQLEAAIAARTDIRGRSEIRFAASQSPDEFASLLTELGATCDAIAGVVVNDQKLDPVVQYLTDRGIPVFALMNDFAQGIRTSYVGLNNLKIGRLAAWLLTRTTPPGKLAIFVGGNRWHGHDLRETGFRSFIREADRGFTILDTRVNLETRQLTYEATLDLLSRHPDLAGLYVAGGGMEGAIAALRERQPTPKTALILHERTSESRAALIDGYALMAIATPLPDLCRDLVAQMIRATRPGHDIPGQSFHDPRILLPEMA